MQVLKWLHPPFARECLRKRHYSPALASSNVFPMPSHHKSALATYQHAPPYGADHFNNSQTDRGYPDIPANGVNYVVAVNGQFFIAFSIGASCPTFASPVGS